MFDILYYDILVIIFEKMDLVTQLRFMSTCKYIYNNFFIKKLVRQKIQPNILLQKKFSRLQFLMVDYSININKKDLVHLNLSHIYLKNRSNYPFTLELHLMTNLKVLHLHNCKINQNSIIGLDLIELNIRYNSFITDVSFMKNLKILNANYTNINQNGIKNLDLFELHVDSNPHIYNVTFMKNLKILNASNNCGIDQNGINGLNLICLYAKNNTKIFNVNFMSNLEILDASCTYQCTSYNSVLKDKYFSNIDQKGVSCLNLKKLNINGNTKIIDVNYMTKLEVLLCSHSVITSLDRLTNICLLNISNTNILDVSCLTYLKILIAKNNELLNIKNLPDLSILYCSKKNIKDLTLNLSISEHYNQLNSKNTLLYSENKIHSLDLETYYDIIKLN